MNNTIEKIKTKIDNVLLFNDKTQNKVNITLDKSITNEYYINLEVLGKNYLKATNYNYSIRKYYVGKNLNIANNAYDKIICYLYQEYNITLEKSVYIKKQNNNNNSDNNNNKKITINESYFFTPKEEKQQIIDNLQISILNATNKTLQLAYITLLKQLTIPIEIQEIPKNITKVNKK